MILSRCDLCSPQEILQRLEFVGLLILTYPNEPGIVALRIRFFYYSIRFQLCLYFCLSYTRIITFGLESDYNPEQRDGSMKLF